MQSKGTLECLSEKGFFVRKGKKEGEINIISTRGWRDDYSVLQHDD